MKNLLIFCTLILAISACEKKDANPYFQEYNISYFPFYDSFTAAASFTPVASLGNPVLLSQKESITFNGRLYDTIIRNAYVWRGTGRPDANFVFTKKKKSITNTIALPKVPDYEIMCNDTVYKSINFIVRVKNYTPKPNHASVHLSNDRRSASNSFKGDSVTFGSKGLKDYETGPARVSLSESGTFNLQNSHQDAGGQMGYFIQFDRPVYITD